MKTTFSFTLTLTVYSVFAANTAAVAQNCSAIQKTIVKDSVTASASTFANLRNRKGSVRYETHRIFTEAKERGAAASKPTSLCPEGCSINSLPMMQFSSVPKSFKQDYGEYGECQTYLEETRVHPLTYNKELELEQEDLEKWLGDFSQGSGPEGKDLYNRCPGSCSPQYSYDIHVLEEKLDVVAHVICGHARDKNENEYVINSHVFWYCKQPDHERD